MNLRFGPNSESRNFPDSGLERFAYFRFVYGEVLARDEGFVRDFEAYDAAESFRGGRGGFLFALGRVFERLLLRFALGVVFLKALRFGFGFHLLHA